MLPSHRDIVDAAKSLIGAFSQASKMEDAATFLNLMGYINDSLTSKIEDDALEIRNTATAQLFDSVKVAASSQK